MGTTIEEVEQYHAATLKLVVQKVNDDAAVLEERQRKQCETSEAERRQHKEHVRQVSERIRFE
jgi:hypothetical protein